MHEPEVFCWLLDVQSLWPSQAGNVKPNREATAQWALGRESQEALDLLPSSEKMKVLRFYHVNDAKLCLGSFLLKHRAIVETCQVPWSDALLGEDSNKKPCYKPVTSNDRTLEFNVSHHGSLVALTGIAGKEVRLGVDIVQINWERDYAMVMKEGFEAWANVYEMVFSDQEMRDIGGYVPPLQSDPREEIRAKLRHFYAHWCLKEAYVKMTGEALLASWLKDLEFRDVKVPMSSRQMYNGDDNLSDWGQTCGNVEIWFHGRQVTDVQLEIQAFREDYMISTAVSSLGVPVSAFRLVDIARDVYPSTLDDQ